jgi:hypothetical protein
MKELVRKAVPKKKKPKKKVKPGLGQKERFIEYAREVEADESGESFRRAMKKIGKMK